MVLERSRILVADAGDPRCVAVDAASGALLATAALSDAAVGPIALHDSAPPSTGVSAWQARGAATLALRLVHDHDILRFVARHYVRLERQGARWSVALTATPEQGTIQDLALTGSCPRMHRWSVWRRQGLAPGAKTGAR